MYLSVRCIWLYVLISSRTPCSKQAQYLKFKWLQRGSNPQLLSSWTNTQLFSPTDQMIELCCDYLSVWCIWLYVLIISLTSFRMHLHSTLYSCLNIKEPLAQNRRNLRSLYDCKGIRMMNHLVRSKQTLNYLAKLTKWLSFALSTYLYGVFNCMFLSCHEGFSE